MPSLPSHPPRHVVRVALDDLRIALDASVVRDVLGPLEITRLPGGPRGLVGVLSWSGRAVAALDLAALVGAPSSSTTRPRTLFVETDVATIALPIDRAYEPTLVDAERPAHAARLEHARLEIDVGGETLPLFDVHEYVKSFEAHT